MVSCREVKKNVLEATNKIADMVVKVIDIFIVKVKVAFVCCSLHKPKEQMAVHMTMGAHTAGC